MKTLQQDFYKYISLSVLGMLGSAGTILADTFFVSDKLGANGLAALNIAICIFGLINGLGLLFGIGGATYYSILRARGNNQKANTIFTASLGVSLLFGVLLLLCGLFFSTDIVRLLGADGIILPMADEYLKTILYFSPFFILRHLFIAFIRNDGSPRLAMASMLISSLANIVLDYWFIYPMEMGIFGAALATGLSPVIGLLVCAVHWMGRKNQFHVVSTSFHWSDIRKITQFGLAAFINEFSSGIVLLVFNLLILECAGTVGVAAYGIIANLALIVMALFTGISQGVQPLLSNAYGAGSKTQISLVYRRSLRLSFLVGLAVVVLTIFCAPTMVSWFNHEHNGELQTLAQQGLVLYFISFLFLGYNFNTTALFSATEKARLAFLLSFFRGCVGIIAAALLFALLWGLNGIWLSVAAIEGVTFLLGIFFTRRTGTRQAQPSWQESYACTID